MTELSRLEQMEDACYDELRVADISQAPTVLTHLGLTHLHMGPDKLKLALREIWAGMHGQTVAQNIGTLSLLALNIAGSPGNPLTQEYADNLKRQTK